MEDIDLRLAIHSIEALKEQLDNIDNRLQKLEELIKFSSLQDAICGL